MNALRDREHQQAQLPVAVIGAGPIGLAAAARLLERGMEPLVLEAGDEAAHSVRKWGHVKLFSPWRYLIDDAAAALLESSGWKQPDPLAHPTGAELVHSYLEPLASLPPVAATIRFNTRVIAVTRHGFDRMKTAGREQAQFLIVTDGPHGEERFLARAVVDASGTWNHPNPLGSGGIPAVGERAAAELIEYGIPDASGSARSRYSGKRTVVVGSGHSAINSVLELVALKRESGSGSVVWAIRRSQQANLFGGGEADQLPERAALGSRVQALVEAGEVELKSGFAVERIDRVGNGLRLVSQTGEQIQAQRIVAATGFRPQLDSLRELRLELDQITEAPVRLAPLIDPNIHSCGTVPPHGEAELAHPEPGFYLVGMKSYGRAPTFLLLTGYEQVRSVVAYLAGDVEAARAVQLTLPETGVCSSTGTCEIPVAGEATCCGETTADTPDPALNCCAQAPAGSGSTSPDPCCPGAAADAEANGIEPCCDRTASKPVRVESACC